VEIAVVHLTRMRAPCICVAGLDRDGRHIRPVPRHGRLTEDDLAAAGGPFAIGAVVDLGATRPCPSPPEVEDHLFDRDASRRTHYADQQ
jgi:hypothetical protein